MTDVFIPDYRVVEAMKMNEGAYEDRQPGKTLYKLKLPGGVLGRDQLRHRSASPRAPSTPTAATSRSGCRPTAGWPSRDPIQLNVYAEAAADVAASRTVLLNEMKELFDHVDKGGEVSPGPSG